MIWRFLRTAFRTVAISLICILAVPTGVVGTVLGSFLFLPLPATLPEPNPPEQGRVSYIYDIHGNEIGEFREFEQSIPVRRENIPLHLKQAVIAAEDRNFYAHSGVDVRGSLRALWVDLQGGGITQGGSTITQQYVKNTYLTKERTIVRKVREAVLASQLDRQQDKDEILFRYLSTVYLGEGAYGVGAAAETYFRKPVSEITISEAAMLAGLIPAPSRYEPRGNPELADQKRRIVLDAMLGQGYLTPEQHAAESALPVWLATNGPPPWPVTMVHPRQTVQTKHPYFVDYLRRFLLSKYDPALVYRGGLRIQTTLDPRLQELAERTHAEALRGTQPPIEMAIASVEPPTGYVKALVGGRDFYAPGGQVNLALGICPGLVDGKGNPLTEEQIEVRPACRDEDVPIIEGGGTGRQPGSSWKPFVLAAAFEKGISPSKVYSAPSKICIRDYCPQNYEGGGGGSATLRSATHRSYNTVYVQLGDDVGIKNVMEMAKKLGITSAWYTPTRHGLSLSLGAQEVAPLEMASAYGVFAARGLRNPPTPVLLIKDPKDNIVEDNRNRQEKAERVIDEVIADNVTDVLRGVISGGTGTAANIGRPAAGKTGTAQEWRDAWFVGYTPTLSTAVWIGNREKPTSLFGVKGVRRVTGGSIPAQTWKRFMSEALEDVPVTEFSEPAPIKRVSDEIRRVRAEQEVDRGSRRSPAGTSEGGPYVHRPPRPRASDPTPPTTQPPPDDDGDPDDGGGSGGGGPPTDDTGDADDDSGGLLD